MDYRRVLLIASVDPIDDGSTDFIAEQAVVAGLDPVTVSAFEAATLLNALVSETRQPGVVLIGPGVLDPLGIARRTHAISPATQLLLVARPRGGEALHEALGRTPMIGSYWALTEVDQPMLSQLIGEAMRSSRQRGQLRTTLDRADLRISQRKPVDSLDYRRLVVSERYLAAVLDQAQDAIVSIDARRRVLFWSAGAERLFSVPATSVVGHAVDGLDFWSTTLDHCLGQIITGARVVRCEISRAAASGALTIEVVLSAVRDDSNAFIGTSLVMRDVSARIELLEIERSARLRAEHVNRMKDEFLAVLSHELRTPLNVILGWSQVLRSGPAEPARLAAALLVIERSARLQAQLVEDLLDMSAAITGKLRLDARSTSLTEIIEAALTGVAPAAERKRLQVTKHLPPDEARIYGDPGRLQQIMQNLLSNAIKFTPDGGAIEVVLTRSATQFRITVKDTGEGIAPDFLAHVFDRFTQGDSSTTRTHGGLGLGLAIVKQLVEMHGGSVLAQSDGPACGACLTVILPTPSAAVSDGPVAP